MTKIFLKQLREATVLGLTLWGSFLGFIFLVGEIKLGDINLGFADILELSLPPVLAIFGFALGERCFPSGLRERHLLFLYSLPIGTSSIWTVIVSARLLPCAAIATAVIIFKFRLAGLYGILQNDPSEALPMHLLFFSAGSLSALLFRRTITTYTTGLTTTALTSFFLVTHFKHRFEIPTIDPTEELVVSMPKGLLVSFLVVLSLSWRVFTRLEQTSAKRRARNLLRTSLILSAYLAIVIALNLAPGFAQLIDSWQPAPRWLFNPSSCRLYSNDGKYAVIVESLQARRWFSRVSILDLQDFRVIYSSHFEGLLEAEWLPTKPVLILWMVRRSALTAPRLTIRLGLNPEGKTVSNRLFYAKHISTLRLRAQRRAQRRGAAHSLCPEHWRLPMYEQRKLWLQFANIEVIQNSRKASTRDWRESTETREAGYYLRAAYSEHDLGLLTIALRNAVDAIGGVAKFAEEARLQKESVGRTLLGQGKREDLYRLSGTALNLVYPGYFNECLPPPLLSLEKGHRPFARSPRLPAGLY